MTGARLLTMTQGAGDGVGVLRGRLRGTLYVVIMEGAMQLFGRAYYGWTGVYSDSEARAAFFAVAVCGTALLLGLGMAVLLAG